MSIVGGFASKSSSVSGGNSSASGDSRELQRQLTEIFEIAIQELSGGPVDFNGTKNVLVGLFVDFLKLNKLNQDYFLQLKCMKLGEVYFVMCGNHAAEIWDDLAGCLTDSLPNTTEVKRGKREANRAWILLISFLVNEQ